MAASNNPAQNLINFGQSVWYDNISRDILDNGELKKLIDTMGVRGLTSNPSIFDNAISKSALYDETIKAAKQNNLTINQTFENLSVEDIARAADLFLPIYNESNGVDGYVSIEVSPVLAADTQGTIEEGIKLFKRLNRPNIMIKVPGTQEGIPAIIKLLEEGINVNITLLFSVDNYVKVAKAYCTAISNRISQGKDVSKLQSVASFFVSRVDSSVDAALNKIIETSTDTTIKEKAQKLLGKFGVANCKLAYQEYKKIFEGEEFKALASKGAQVQRPLWASTSTKNPTYRDVIYVEEIIGKNTVNTMPHQTLIATADHAVLRDSIEENVADAKNTLHELTELGVNIDGILKELQVDGVKKFIDSFHSLNKSIQTKYDTF